MFEVVVGNVGTVYTGESSVDAYREYCSYVAISRKPGCRASGELVVLFDGGEPTDEYDPEDIVPDVEKLERLRGLRNAGQLPIALIGTLIMLEKRLES